MSNMTVKTSYVHKDGPIVISQGIGDKLWGVFVEKPNGSLKRFCWIEMQGSPLMALRALQTYKGKAIQCNHPAEFRKLRSPKNEY